MGKALNWLGFLVGTAALAMQLVISVATSLSVGRPLVDSVVYVFSFFTIWTNIAVIAVHGAAILRWPSLPMRPSVRAAVAVAALVVMLSYAVMLDRLWKPEGLFLVANVALHYVAPILYLAWWLLFGRDGSVRGRDAPFWLAFPLAYLCWALLRGAVVGEYPYPFLDLATKSAAEVALACLALLATFLIVSALAVAIDRSTPIFGRKL